MTRQSSERADEKLVDVVAGDILHHAAAALGNDALAGDELHSQQEIPRRSMSIAQWRVRACGDDSAERGAFRKRRRKRQELTSRAELRDRDRRRLMPGSTPRVRSRGS